MERIASNPPDQEIVDHDIAVNNYLLEIAGEDPTAKVLAVGLAAIHERLGRMWIWEKNWRS